MSFVGVFLGGTASIGCVIGNVQKTGPACLPHVPIGPGGEAVQDNFYFVRKQLTGNGSITARLTSLTSLTQVPPGGGGPNHVHVAGPGPGQQAPSRPCARAVGEGRAS